MSGMSGNCWPGEVNLMLEYNVLVITSPGCGTALHSLKLNFYFTTYVNSRLGTLAKKRDEYTLYIYLSLNASFLYQ